MPYTQSRNAHTQTHTSCMMHTTESKANTLDEFNGINMWPNTLERIRTREKNLQQ